MLNKRERITYNQELLRSKIKFYKALNDTKKFLEKENQHTKCKRKRKDK